MSDTAATSDITDSAAPDAVPLLRRTGIVAAALTPLDDDGNVVVDEFDRQIDWLADLRPLAISVAGVEVQEYHLLDVDQRVALVRRAVERSGGVPVVGGVTAPTPKRSAELARAVADAGAAAVLALVGPKPWAAPQRSDELLGWFSYLADESPVPIVVYSNPRTGSEPSVGALAELAGHPNIGAVKETSRDMVKVLGLCEELALPGKAGVYTNMETLLATLVMGGQGAMVPAPGVPMANRLVEQYLAGDLDAARATQRFFVKFPSAWMSLGLGPVVKAAMELMGVGVGRPFEPFRSLSESELGELERHLGEWGLLA